jgi:hypothetical protein
MAFDVLHLLRPAAIVHPIGFVASSRRQAIEAGFGDGQQGPIGKEKQVSASIRSTQATMVKYS